MARKNKRKARGPLIALTLGAWLYFSGTAESFVFGVVSAYEHHVGLPGCDWKIGKSDAKRAFDNSQSARTLNLSVIAT